MTVQAACAFPSKPVVSNEGDPSKGASNISNEGASCSNTGKVTEEDYTKLS